MPMTYAQRRDFINEALAIQAEQEKPGKKEEKQELTAFQELLLGAELTFPRRQALSAQQASWLGQPLTTDEKLALGLPAMSLRDRVALGQPLSKWQQKIHETALAMAISHRAARRELYAQRNRW